MNDMDIRKPPPEGNGLDLSRQRAEESPDDWQFGALSIPSLVSIPEAERETWLPKGEVQGGVQDFADCASRSPVNHLESIFTYHYQHEMKPENKVWLETNGYVGDDKRVTFSDRWVAIGSGTTRSGNSLRAPIDFLRKGLIPKKMLPKEDWMDWPAYHDPSKITQAMRDVAVDFAKRFTIHYEAVSQTNFSEVLKNDFLGVAGHAWPVPINGVYPPSDNQFNHAFLLYKNPKWQAFDNYLEAPDDYTKNLSPFFKFYEVAYRVYLASEQVLVEPLKTPHLFLKNMYFQQIDPEVAELQKALVLLGYGIPDGITDVYGKQTRSAVTMFQIANGITGNFGQNFGPRCRLALNKKLSPTTPFGGSFLTYIQAFFSGV